MYESELRKELTFAGKRLMAEKLVHSNLGTISACLNREKGRYLVKPGPMDYEGMGPDEFIEVGIDGAPFDKTNDPPSLNWLAHRASYETRPDIGAVIHAHPNFIVAITSQKNIKFDYFSTSITLASHLSLKMIPLISEEAVWLYKPTELNSCGAVPVVEDLPPEKLAEAARKMMLLGNGFVIRNHGIMTVGKNLREALALVIEMECQAKIFATIVAMGGSPIYREPSRVASESKNMPPWFTKPFQP